MSNKDILYIEDNFHNRRIVRKILERQGYILHEREDGLEGYEFLKELRPGVVLLDISLPTMDGMEIARRVKEDPEVQHIYLIALTASAMQGDRERFLEAGCDDYLSKPFRALDLVDLVNKYADLVAANVPAPPPQPSELHDTGPLETEKKETFQEPIAMEAADQPEPVVEAAPEMETVQVEENEEAVEVEAEAKPEEADAVPMLEQAAEDVEEPVEPDEPESDWKLEKDLAEFRQGESEQPDPPDTAELSEEEVSQVEVESAESVGAPASETEDLVKANGKKSKRKAKKTEAIDAIKAGIRGVINPDNLKPVDPNNHQDG